MPAETARASSLVGWRSAPWLLGGGILAAYAATLAPTVTWRNGGSDGPELTAAAYVWGVAHPPGYPLYLVALRLAQLLPVGDIAYRANLFSALSGVAAAVLTLHLVRAVVRDPAWRVRLGGYFGACVLAFSPLFWSQAVVAEVYTFGLALLALFLLATVAWLDHPSRERTLIVGVTLALMSSHHPPLLVAFVPYALAAVRRGRPFDAVGVAGVVGVLAPLLFLTLWLRASLQPPIDWGDPSTLDRWLRHVQALDYRPYLLARPTADELPRIPFAASLLVRQGGWFALGLAALGFVWLWSQRRLLALMLGLLATCFSIFAVLYNAQDSELYLLPTVLVLAVAAGVGACWLLVSLPPRAAAFLPLMLATSVAWQVSTGWPEVSAAGDTAARTVVQSILDRAPPGSIARSTDEAYTFTLWYLQHVEHQRPDVAVVDDRLLQFAWYREQLVRLYPQIRGRGIAD